MPPADDPTILLDDECNTFVAKPFYVDTTIRNLLRIHYSRNSRRSFPGLDNVHWVPDNRSAGVANDPESMRIDLADSWNPSRTGSAPSLIIRGNDIGSVRLGIADHNQSPSVANASGERTYTRAFASSITMFCGSRIPRTSRLLALETANHLQQFAYQLRQRLGLARFQVGRIGMVKPLREQPTILVSPVVLEYAFFETWHVQPAARKIKSFDYQSHTNR